MADKRKIIRIAFAGIKKKRNPRQGHIVVIFKEQKLQIYVLMTPRLSAAITLGTHCAAGGLVISAQSKKKKKSSEILR